MKHEMEDEVKILMKEIYSLDDHIDKLEGDNLELHRQMKKENVKVDQRKLNFDGKLKK